jgi:hypothetical protein
MPKKTADLTNDNWERLEYLMKNGVYTTLKDAMNDTMRRGLPSIEKETGFKKARV